MDFKTSTLREINATRGLLERKRVFAGFDGFVDTIVTPVDRRVGVGENFTPIETIGDFGQRVLRASGKSTNIELFPRVEKLGGNGPIMAVALLAAGAQLSYAGALGKLTVHPVFQEFARRAHVTSLCDPATTTAIEFVDGKLMLGQMRSLDEITFEKLVHTMGEIPLREAVAGSDLIALVNWTMIPGMTAIFAGFLEEILPALPGRDRLFFFDLADPEKRSVEDLLKALEFIGKFEDYGRVTLGLNLKEAQQVMAANDRPTADTKDESTLRTMAEQIRADVKVSTVVIHPRESAACATTAGTAWIPGPYTETPLVTTGAGDHFNAGFSVGQLLGLTPPACLALGVCVSGHYVRTGRSPTLGDTETFLANWK